MLLLSVAAVDSMGRETPDQLVRRTFLRRPNGWVSPSRPVLDAISHNAASSVRLTWQNVHKNATQLGRALLCREKGLAVTLTGKES